MTAARTRSNGIGVRIGAFSTDLQHVERLALQRTQQVSERSTINDLPPIPPAQSGNDAQMPRSLHAVTQRGKRTPDQALHRDILASRFLRRATGKPRCVFL